MKEINKIPEYLRPLIKYINSDKEFKLSQKPRKNQAVERRLNQKKDGE